VLLYLSASDLDVLRETEEELNLAGAFARIFPSPSSHLYSALFPARYHNMLLLHWVERYGTARVDLVRVSTKEPYIPAKEPYIFTKETSMKAAAPQGRALHIRKRALHILKRALHIRKRALHIRQRALHI